MSSITPTFYCGIVISLLKYNLLQSLQRVAGRGSEPPLNSEKIKVALNPFLQLVKLCRKCTLTSLLLFHNKKWGSPSSFLSYKYLNLKLRVSFTGHTVTMVTKYTTKMTITSSSITGHSLNTIIIVASTDKDW